MKRGFKWVKGCSPIVAILLFLVVGGCGKSAFEEGRELYDKGLYEQALPLLDKAKREGEHFIQADDMIRQAKIKIEEAAEEECVRRAENYLDILSQTKTVDTWDKIIQELKSFKCRKLNVRPHVDKAFYRFVTYLAQWDHYPDAVNKYCEYSGCEAKPPHVLIREEEIVITDEDGKEKEEVIQQEIPIAEHSIAVEMFKWLVRKDAQNARWFDRYAKFLYDTERYTDALGAYSTIAEMGGIGYEFKSRAKVVVDHLKKGGLRPRAEGENYRFFWIEQVRSKSKLKALKKDLEKARREREEAEKRKQAADDAR